MRMPTQTGSQLVERTDPFVVELDRFQGPLDLLLHLIRCQDIDIFDIPIAQITGQFIAAVHEAEKRFSLERAGEFLEMAATLVRIKAQLLLPRRDELLDEDPRSELVRRLLEYEQFREVAYALAEAESDRALCFAKGYVTPRVLPELTVQPLELSLDEFVEVALSLPVPPVKRPHTAPVRTITVDDKIELWLGTLAQTGRSTLQEFARRWKTRVHAVMSFLACLELAKRGRVKLRQRRPFGELWVDRNEKLKNR